VFIFALLLISTLCSFTIFSLFNAHKLVFCLINFYFTTRNLHVYYFIYLCCVRLYGLDLHCTVHTCERGIIHEFILFKSSYFYISVIKARARSCTLPHAYVLARACMCMWQHPPLKCIKITWKYNIICRRAIPQ